MKVLIFIIMFLTGCTSLKTNELKQTWKVIEDAPSKHWSRSNLENVIGVPNKEMKNPTKKIHLALLYEQDNRQKWGITMSKHNIVESVTYLPTNIYRHEFTIEKIMDRWKDLNCKKEEKQILTPHVIKKERFISCDNGKRIIHYNRYNEVESILVKGQ